jgi:hypothetical protein
MGRELATTAQKLRRLQKKLGVFADAAHELASSLGSLLEDFERPQDRETGKFSPSPVEALARSYANELSSEKPDVLEKLTGVKRSTNGNAQRGPMIGKAKSPEANSTEDLNATDVKILAALVQLGGSAPWPMLSVFTGLLHKTGNVGMSLARMRREAFLAGTSSEFQITQAGRQALESASAVPSELPRGYKLFEFWCEKLGTTEAKILKAIRAGEKTALGMGFTHKTGATGMALAKLKRIKFITGTDGSFKFTDTFKAACDPSVRVYDTASGAQHLVDARGTVRK